MSFTPRRQIRRARSLRGADTAAKARLWSNLRGRRLQNFKFVRQAPIGPYVVDGATRSEDWEITYDRKREIFLKAEEARHNVIRGSKVPCRCGEPRPGQI